MTTMSTARRPLSGLRVGHVRLQVADADRSAVFYQHVLGLNLLDRSGEGVRLGGPGGALLVDLHEKRGAAPIDRRGRLGLFHFAILLPDRPALGRFLAHVAPIGLVAGAADHAVSEAIYLSDPDGLGIEVYADRPKSVWRYPGGELHMTTEPLDVRGLSAAAAGQPWTGVPAGTTMGHVHLSVNDLDRAARFYGEGLGLDATVTSYPGARFLSAGGYHHHLGLNTWSSGSPVAGQDDARLLEWHVALASAADVEAAADRLRRIGAEVISGADGVRAVDPWGTGLVITV